MVGAAVRASCACVLWVVVSGTVAAYDVDDTWNVLDSRFVIDVVAEDLRLPINIAFVPDPGTQPKDPFFYVTELYGTIKVVSRDGTVKNFVTGLQNYTPPGGIPGAGESGVAGIAVHPDTGDVYATLMYETGSPDTMIYGKIERFTSTDGGRTAATQTTILDFFPYELWWNSHQISRLSFGPDGKLYCHVGDGGNSWKAQWLDHFKGKIIRLNPDGSAPTDNPYYDAADGIDPTDYVYAYGFRNPFGGDWRETDGMLYEVENGMSVDRFAKVTAGWNYFWGVGEDTDDNMLAFAMYNWDPSHSPVNLAFIQTQSFCTSGFPEDLHGHAFVTEYGTPWKTGPDVKGKRIVEFSLGEGGPVPAVLSGPTTIVEYIGSGKATTVALAAGPDGLYFSDLFDDDDFVDSTAGGAKVLRLRPLDPNLLKLTMGADTVLWDPLPFATAYDLIRGDLATLHTTGGDYGQATTNCLAESTTVSPVVDANVPGSGQGFWYLMRYETAGGRACYESNAVSQYGLRDADVSDSGNDCQ